MHSTIVTLLLIAIVAGSTTLAQGAGTTDTAPPPDIDGLMTAIYVLFAVVLLGMPVFSAVIRIVASNGARPVGLRAFNLPNGSIRAMLGLLVVGSFILVLAWGLSFRTGDVAYFSQVVTAFATLAGSVTGFYFGGRSSAPVPSTDKTDQMQQ